MKLRLTSVMLVAVGSATSVFPQQQRPVPSHSAQACKDDSAALPDDSVTWFDTGQYLPRGNGVKLGRPYFAPDPEYSEYARQKKIAGTVLLALAVNAGGTVDTVKVVRSLEPSLDQEAVDAVKLWKFTPATRDGKAVAIQIPVSVGFSLY